MQLVQLKYNIARWMVAKTRLRKDVLKDSTRAEVRWMYKQTLWCSDIFPRDAISKLRNLNNNTIDVPILLGLTKNLRQNNNSNNNGTNNANIYRHQNKRQRTEVQKLVHTTRTNTPQNTNNSRANQTQRPNYNNANPRPNYNNANPSSNSGPNNGKQANQHNKGQGSKAKKSFPKKKSGNSQ